MAGNQDTTTLTGRTLAVLEILLAETVAEAVDSKPEPGEPQAAYVRELKGLAGLGRTLNLAIAAGMRVERGLEAWRAEKRRREPDTRAAEDDMNEPPPSQWSDELLETKRTELFRKLDAIAARRSGGGACVVGARGGDRAEALGGVVSGSPDRTRIAVAA